MSQSDFSRRFVTTPDVLAAYDEVVTAISGLLAVVTPDCLGKPTPCAQWTVNDLLCHLAFINERYTAVAEQAPDPPFNHSFFLDPVVAFAEWASKARGAWHSPGFLTTVIPTPIGQRSGDVVVQHVVNELTTHRWDLAKALDRDADLLPELAEQVLASWQFVFHDLGDPRRSPATIGTSTQVPAWASANDRLAAFLGRDVAWRQPD